MTSPTHFHCVDRILRILFHSAGWRVGDKAIGFVQKQEFLRSPSQEHGFCALCSAVDSEKNHWRRGWVKAENYALARGHKEFLMQSQTITSSLLVLLADSVSVSEYCGKRKNSIFRRFIGL